MKDDGRDDRAVGALVATLSVDRYRALTRGILWASGCIVLGAAVWLAYANLSLKPTGLSNRLVEIGIAIAALPLVLMMIVCAVQSLRWLSLGLWPGKLAIEAWEKGLVLRLGPFGTRQYATRHLSIQYPFELESGDEDRGFESFLPEDRQRATMLPRITHPRAGEPINIVILRFSVGSEEVAAKVLRPALDRWRTDRIQTG